MPELELPPLDAAAVTHCLARAFSGLTLVKEAQAAPLRDAFLDFIGRDRLEWLNELAPAAIPWLDDKKLKLLYPGRNARRRRPPQLPRSERETARDFPAARNIRASAKAGCRSSSGSARPTASASNRP